MTWEKYPGGRTNIQEFFRGKKSLLLKILFSCRGIQICPLGTSAHVAENVCLKK